jgi:YidC/Oxa1 family membrane protein insertase
MNRSLFRSRLTDYKAACSVLTLFYRLSIKALQPTIKDIQAKYQSNPEVMNQKIAEIYKDNSVNPLAGCLPSIAQIPIFIGLYRAVLELAKSNQLDEPFLWLPNLEGPVYGADPTKGSAWLFDGWVDGAPSLGWDDTLKFLILPVFLVISQFVSMEIMQPKDSQQQGNAVLKVLPLMIGWFSLNVPAALTLYWVTNNIVTTASSVVIRNSMKMEPVAAGGATMDAPAPTKSEIFAPSPIREKPAGFSSAPAPTPSDGVSPITSTSVVDAEIVEDGAEGEGMGDQKKVSRCRV